MIEYAIITGIAAFGAGFAIAYWMKGKLSSRLIKAAEDEADRLIKDGKRASETLLKEAQIEAKDTLFRMKSDFDKETKETRAELKKREMRLMQKEEKADRKAEQQEAHEQTLGTRENQLNQRETRIQSDEEKYQQLLEEQKQQFEKISGLTAEQAKDLLLRAMENEARYEGAKLIKRIENEARGRSRQKVQEDYRHRHPTLCWRFYCGTHRIGGADCQAMK